MTRRTLTSGRRGLSREGVAALGFGLTIAMMAVVGGVLMQTGDTLSDSSSGIVVTTSADSISAGGGPGDQWVRIYHDSGERVAAENLSVTVRLPEHRKRSTLENLPTKRIEPGDYDGNHVFSLGDRAIEGPIDAGDGDATWGAGETIGFRLAHDRVALEDSQRVNVTVTRIPTESTLAKHSLTVGE